MTQPQSRTPDNIMKLDSFVRGKWSGAGEPAAEIHSAVTGDVVALAGGSGRACGATVPP